MSNISEIDKSLIPQNAVLCKKGMRTKKIYLNEDDLTDVSVKENIFAQNETESLNFKNTYMGPATSMNIYLKENGMSKESTIVAEKVNGNIHLKKSFVVTIDKPMEILYDAPKYIYCIEELPPPEIIPIDKAPTTTSLNDITNYINKTTESIKSCKSYIAYIINNKGGSATDTETLESLIDKLNDVFQISPDNPTPPLDMMVKPSKLRLSARFHEINYKLQEINDLLKVSSDNLKTIMDANNLLYEPTDNFSTLVKKLNNEPINFLLEGTKVRDILRKHIGTMIYAPDAGATYNDLMFTDSLPSDAQDLKEDLSQKQDGSILLLKKSISDGSRTYDTYYIYSNKKIYANKNSSYMFNLGVNYFNNIYFNNFYGEYIENASHLFNVTYSNASAVYVTLNKFENVILNNLVNIDYMFNDCAIKLNRSITITNKIKTYNNFYSKFNSYQESYGSITLNYIDNESKKIAESIISEVNDNFVKLGTLVTQ